MVLFAARAGAGPRVDDNGRVVFAAAAAGDNLDVVVGPGFGGEVHFVVRSHDDNGAWRGGALDVVINGTGRFVVETRVNVPASSWSVQLLPKTGVPCPDHVCVSLLGDWPR